MKLFLRDVHGEFPLDSGRCLSAAAAVGTAAAAAAAHLVAALVGDRLLVSGHGLACAVKGLMACALFSGQGGHLSIFRGLSVTPLTGAAFPRKPTSIFYRLS